MSDDERSDSESGSGSDEVDDLELETNGLVATRAKRATAGNLYASLRANLDDEELQKELLAEDEDDAASYEGSEKDDEDDALESSSDEEDAGPPREGDEDLEGEKVLRKQERAEVRKKRKVQDARLKLPAWQKKNKKVKLADDVKTEDGSAPEKSKKKSERANWLPTPADAPTRQSGRSLAVANREVTHANLKESYERSEKQRRVMKNAAEREKTTKRMVMSQEERLKVCEKIAIRTDKEFGRWERDEKERQRLRDEALAAKRSKGFEGPFVRHWSGSVVWEGDRIRVRRVSHGSKRVEEIKDEPKVDASSTGGGDLSTTRDGAVAGPSTLANQQAQLHQHSQSTSQPAEPWLQGIHDYASQPAPTLPHQSQKQPPPPPIACVSNASLSSILASNTTASPHTYPPAPPSQQPSYPPPASATYGGWPPGAQSFPINLPPPPPPAPLIREQAQRSLVILEQFEQLDQPSKRPKTTSTLEPTAPASLLMPESFPPFSADETRYLTTKHKRAALPPTPEKPMCSIICSAEARFRDPKTGLPYYDLHTYKIIQRVLAGGCSWSSLLGAWVGPSYGVMGRPAKGVPEGFAGASAGEVKAEVKAEGSGG